MSSCLRFRIERLALFGSILLGASSAWGQECLTERVSVSSQGQQGSGDSFGDSLSFDGRFVGFESYSSNLVPGDNNHTRDAFVHDRRFGTTERVSLSTAGIEGNGISGSTFISDDGRYAVFISIASNLDPADTDTFPDIYVRDRQAQTTQLITKRIPGMPTLFGCWPEGISADGRQIVFSSQDVNLVTQVDTNGSFADVFVADLTGAIELVSLDSGGIQAQFGALQGRISMDGRYVVMVSDAPNWQPNAVFPVATQVFRRDRQLGTLDMVSLRPDGIPGAYPCVWPSVSGDGRFVAFESNGDDLVTGAPPNANVRDVFVRDIQASVTELITWNKDGAGAFAGGRLGRLSRNGRFVVFESDAWDLVVQDNNFGKVDIFVRDRQAQLTTLISRSWQGKSLPHGAQFPAISGDGRVACFSSIDNSVVPNKVGFNWDVYVRECSDGLTSVWCGWVENSLGCKPVVSLDGVPNVSGTGGFRVECDKLVGKTIGLFYYGTTGAQGAVFQSGFQCVRPPLSRAAPRSTGGNGPPLDCSGSLTFTLDEWVASKKDLRLVPGTTVYGQFWSRDPGAVPATHLSSAVAFTLQP